MGGLRPQCTWQGRIFHNQDQQISKVISLYYRHANRYTLGSPRSIDRFGVLALGSDSSGIRSQFPMAKVTGDSPVPRLNYNTVLARGFRAPRGACYGSERSAYLNLGCEFSELLIRHCVIRRSASLTGIIVYIPDVYLSLPCSSESFCRMA